MAGVPSDVKITKNGVEYLSRVDLAKYSLRQLTRRAMQDVGRYVLYEVRKQVRGLKPFLRKSKYAANRYQLWVRKKENDLILGIENTSKGAVSAWWADQSELGTAGQPKRAILHDTVLQNVDKIVEIEAHYLSYMNDDAAAAQEAAKAGEADVLE